MGSITCDFGQDPLITITFDGAVSDEVFEKQYLATLQNLVVGNEKRVMLYDSRKSGMANAKQRQLQADWMRLNKDNIKANTLGCVFVLDSAITRGMLTAILWLQPMPCPHAVVATIEEGWSRAQEWLAEANLSVPAVAKPERKVITG